MPAVHEHVGCCGPGGHRVYPASASWNPGRGKRGRGGAAERKLAHLMLEGRHVSRPSPCRHAARCGLFLAGADISSIRHDLGSTRNSTQQGQNYLGSTKSPPRKGSAVLAKPISRREGVRQYWYPINVRWESLSRRTIISALRCDAVMAMLVSYPLNFIFNSNSELRVHVLFASQSRDLVMTGDLCSFMYLCLCCRGCVIPSWPVPCVRILTCLSI